VEMLIAMADCVCLAMERWLLLLDKASMHRMQTWPKRYHSRLARCYDPGSTGSIHKSANERARTKKAGLANTDGASSV
jgi:hypothetical protein